MNQTSNRLWILAFPLSVLFLITALYIKKAGAREFIDRKCPWVKETVGKYAPPFEVRIVGAPPAAPAPAEEGAPLPPPALARTAPPVSTPPPAPAPAPKPEPNAPVAVAESFDLSKVCADPTRWPKTVRLKAIVDFPAVVDGKVVGKLRAPVGTEARVVKLSNGQVGVEYHGGGAWLALDNTDFVERARIAWR